MRESRTLIACILVAAAQQASADIQFTDVTPGSGINYTGETYGAAWGDYNGDGLPDLFVSHHRRPGGFFLNLGDGTFEDRHNTVDVWQQFPTRDQHGGTWVDFDNDGDQDLFVALGSKAPTQFLVNNGDTLSDQISQFTFDPDPHWQGRTVTYFDYSGDGNLDFGIGTTKQAYHVHRQTVDQSGARDFLKQTGQVGLSQIKTDHYGQLADLTFDGKPELILQSESQNFPHRIFGIGTVPFTDLTSLLPGTPITNDSLFADFDGDLRQDALAVSGKVRLNGGEITAPNRIEAQIIADNAVERGISFQATGDITVVLHWSARSVSRTFIGTNGLHPPLPPAGQPITFTLSPDDPNVVGIMPHSSSTSNSVYIGYTPATQTWQLFNASGGQAGEDGEWSYVYTYITSTGTVSNLTVSPLTAGDMPRAPVLLANPTGNQWINRTSAAGLNIPVPCVSGVAADFDNDMDMDIYLVCRNAVSNAQDILYENTGGGVFVAVSGAGGAPGPLGTGVGTGDSVVTADFDADGFVDLFQTNGLALFPIHPFSTGGPDKLYRNAGISNGSNHWIELDFAGTTSNRDGIGAIVTVTAGGVAQRKERNGGIHRWSQNHQRLHFGLASNTTANIEVRWPSGALVNYPGVSADHLYRVSEDGGIEEVEIGGEPPPSPCGPPTYNKATERALFIWKNCATDAWIVRVTSGGGSWVVYQGNVQSDQNFTSVTGFSIEANDTLNVSDPSRIVYSLGVGGTSEDGYEFKFPAGTAVCFNRTAPTSQPVYLGLSRTQMSVPFDLSTLGACN